MGVNKILILLVFWSGRLSETLQYQYVAGWSRKVSRTKPWVAPEVMILGDCAPSPRGLMKIIKAPLRTSSLTPN
jgi:hypothetical protein